MEKIEALVDDKKKAILKHIDETQPINSLYLTQQLKLPHQEVVGLLKSLEMAEMVVLTQLETKNIVLTADGQDSLDNGSPENVYINFLKQKGGEVKKNEVTGQISKIAEERGFSAAMKLKAIKYAKDTNTVSLIDKSKEFPDEVHETLKKIKDSAFSVTSISPSELTSMTKAKLLNLETVKYFDAKKGQNFSLEIIKPETDLTTELIANGDYKIKQFKKYNYNTKGLDVPNGALHPLMKVRAQFREIMLELGFQEMPTNNFVESSFWNFDTLFQPQQHPARDAHDTFFLTNPKYSDKLKDKYGDYLNRVKEIHEKGGFGSLGWRYNFSEEETLKNILRTHTTAVSSRMLYKLAQDYKETGKFTPKKYFSIDRVFRNETLDSTHLCEFFQIEGVVADYNLGLGHLIGTIEGFFSKFGIKKLRFKPAYNPYTEPSMEIFSYHEKLKRWVEIGNSGIFRPEMLLPMGLPADVSVIAWGLSLERPTMIYYGLSSIKDLSGEEVQLRETKNASIYCINIA